MSFDISGRPCHTGSNHLPPYASIFNNMGPPSFCMPTVVTVLFMFFFLSCMSPMILIQLQFRHWAWHQNKHANVERIFWKHAQNRSVLLLPVHWTSSERTYLICNKTEKNRIRTKIPSKLRKISVHCYFQLIINILMTKLRYFVIVTKIMSIYG